jgi:vacuolar-type H+-ATPase subunit I/STV1
VSDAVSPLGRGVIYEDLFFQPPAIPLVARFLLPFGLPMTADSGYGYGLSYVLGSSFIVGALALLVGALFVAAVTRRSNDAVAFTGPYMVYGLLAALWLSRGDRYFQSIGELFPILLGALLMPMLVGVCAKLIAVTLRNQGWLEIDAPAEGSSQFEALHLEGLQGEGAPAGGGLELQPAELPHLQHVTYAAACPFCGNPKIAHDKPRSCGRCHRNIALAIEHTETRCTACDGALVKDASFCHHCARWLKNDVPDGLEVA